MGLTLSILHVPLPVPTPQVTVEQQRRELLDQIAFNLRRIGTIRRNIRLDGRLLPETFETAEINWLREQNIQLRNQHDAL